MAEVITMPKLGFDMAEGTLVRWVVSEGEMVEKGAVLAEIETDKATVEVESNFGGVLLRQIVAAGYSAAVNAPIAVIGEAGEQVDLQALLGEDSAPAETVKPAKEVTPAAQDVTDIAPPAPVTVAEGESLPGGVRATPLARRMAAEQGIDLRKVTGSGPKGRVTKEDIEAYATQGAKDATSLTQPTPALTVRSRKEQRVPLSRLRAIIGRRMVDAVRSAPHFYVTRDFDVAALMELRSQVNALLPDDQKTSVNDYILKAVALGLVEFPNLNASIDEAKAELIWHGQIHVGVAVAVENGLLTVVCRDTDVKTIRQISSEVRGLVERARQGKVRPDDIEGSTFSVSNLGMFDVEQFTAIINPPEAAILAVGAVRHTPVVVNGELQKGIRMKATLSVDHRVSDGAEAARFMQAVATTLEQPLQLLV